MSEAATKPSPDAKDTEKQAKTGKKQEKHVFGAEISKVLKLMINSLYTNRDIFLRELISNASDACDKLRYEALQDDSLLKDDPELRITLTIDEKKRRLTITDNGVGMNHDDLIDNLGTIARSGTQEFAGKLTGEKDKDVSLIGQFGVGFYSAFMVAEKVEVKSRKAGEDKGWLWNSDGEGEFEVSSSTKKLPRGTSITLHLREDEDEYLDSFRLEHIVKTYSDHISFPIILKGEQDDNADDKVLNKGSAIWTRQKSDISEEDYKEFYKHVSHLPDSPWQTLHARVEGALEYTYLLYIPSMRPFDLFHPDRMRRVKLYVKRVFITEEGVDIIPHWLRFMRGIVDSEDLPLNISRETLQHNRLLEKIKDSITKKVISELKKKAEKDTEGYAAFWENFGPVLKEGLCEGTTDKTSLLEVCRFYSSTSPDTLVSLDDYIDRMKDGQQNIYFLTGDEVESMRNNPQLEGFTKQGYEVLFLNDHVDTFWVNTVNQYKEIPMLSVNKAKLDEAGADKDDSEKSEDELQQEANIEALIEKLRTTYGEQVRDIRTTSKLTDSPVCLAIGEGDMDIRMERFLVENKQIAHGIAKILEINPTHPIILKLAGMAEKEGEGTDFTDAAFLLLDQAKIIEGEDVRDPAAFARRISMLMERGL